jgi:hypothetical protein
MNDIWGLLTDPTQDVAKYVKEQIIPKAPSLEFSMIALAGGFPEEKGVQGSGA